jgi:hypothetical protein
LEAEDFTEPPAFFHPTVLPAFFAGVLDFSTAFLHLLWSA